MLKSKFPIFVNNPDLVYLDNAASTQKPQMVIDQVSYFLEHEYANIHRGLYSLSEKSEIHYYESKKLVAELVNCSVKEVIYTYNATASVNLIAQTLVKSKKLTKDDVVLVGLWDHHANSLPWMSLAEMIGFKVEFIEIDENYQIDWEDFHKKYTDKVKVVACGQVSNVTGAIYDVEKIKSKLRSDTFFVVDASQSAPNMLVDFQKIGCDALVFTGHKMMAHTGIGILVLKNQRIKELQPLAVGGGTIKDVSIDAFSLQTNNEKFEAGTPNIVAAVSLEYALKFIQSLTEENTLSAGIHFIHQQEQKLIQHALPRFLDLKDSVNLVGPKNPEERVAVFSFVLKEQPNFNQVGEFFAEKNICIRCGGHCAYPLHKHYHLGGTCRMSAYCYNDLSDIDRFFDRLTQLIDS